MGFSFNFSCGGGLQCTETLAPHSFLEMPPTSESAVKESNHAVKSDGTAKKGEKRKLVWDWKMGDVAEKADIARSKQKKHSQKRLKNASSVYRFSREGLQQLAGSMLQVLKVNRPQS